MAWHFRKSQNFGRIRTTVCKKGIGSSISVLGFRFGVTAEGKKFWSFGVTGTGFYYIKYYK